VGSGAQREESAVAEAFVTGGSGFLGRNLITALLARGDVVRALARSDRAAQAVRDLGAHPVVGDLEDGAGPVEALKGCAVVYHAAAKVEGWGKRRDFWRVNVEGTQRLLDGAQKAQVPRFVHVSTEAVLVGGGPIINADESRPLPRRSRGLYPSTKAAAEERVRAANGNALATMIARPRFIWGQGDTSLLPQIIDTVKRGRFRWIGDGHTLTSTCHVKNVAHGLILAAEKGRGGETYFLTDGDPVDMRVFLTRLLATQGVDPGNASVPHGVALVAGAVMEGLWTVLPLPGAPPVTRTEVRLFGEEVTVSDAKARRELGYEPVISMEEGLAEMGLPDPERTPQKIL
jgi:nucleoside-diphosphate-sugar epimerase